MALMKTLSRSWTDLMKRACQPGLHKAKEGKSLMALRKIHLRSQGVGPNAGWQTAFQTTEIWVTSTLRGWI